MDDLLKGVTGGGQGQGAGGIGDLLGNLLGGGNLGSVLGAGAGAGIGNSMGGGLGSVFGGGVGALIPTLLPAILGMLGGRTPANQSGLHQVVDTMHASGLGAVAQSWVGSGPNQPITAAQVEHVFTPEQLAELSAKSGIPADQVSAGVASILPHVVNSLTSGGTLPEPAQVQGVVGQLQQALAGLTAALGK